jgi:hypothetical protein
MLWGVVAEFMMGGVVEVGSAVSLDSIACTVRRDRCEECVDACVLGCDR